MGVFVIDRKFRLDKKTAIVDGVAASFDDDGGILEIAVPKNVLAGPRTIPIAVVTKSEKADDHDHDHDHEEEDDQAEDATSPVEEEKDHPETAISVQTVQEEDETDGHEDEEEE